MARPRSSRDAVAVRDISSPTRDATVLAPLGAIKEVLRGERAPLDLAETRQALTEMARRKSGRLPAALLVEQVLKVTEGTDWPARRAALDALLRRLGFAVRDGLSIAERPADGAMFGRYVLASQPAPKAAAGRKRSLVRPYATEIYGLDPLHVSCDCADFVRGSLGVCKHTLVVLEDLLAVPSKNTVARLPIPTAHEGRARLGWEPTRSWVGPGDRLAGLRWQPAQSTASASRRPAKRERNSVEVIAAAFEADHPRSAALAEPDQRTALLQALVAAAEAGIVQTEPAALAVVRDELQRGQRRRASHAGAKEVLSHLKTLKRKLYPYQLAGVRRFVEEQRLLLADDMGLGKTTQAIAACHALYAAGRVRRGLLIVPAPLKDQWFREWHATTDRVPLSIVEGRLEERARQYRQTTDGYLIMNYEQLLRDLESVRRFAPEIVVLDEAQRIKNWATKSNAYVMSLDPEWRLVLTGTPMENRLEELATLLDWIDDTALAPKWRLLPWHTEWGTEGRGGRIGARHLDTVRQRVSHCVVRRVRREVLDQLPPRTDVRVPVEMTEQQREEHDARIAPIAQLTQTAQRRPLRQAEFLALMQLLAQQRIVSNGMALLRFDEIWPTYSRGVADEALLTASCSPKLLEFRRVITDLAIQQGRKIVVFSQWRKMLRLAEWAIRDVLDAEGLGAVFFTGEESQTTRTRNIVDFHDDATVRVMFLSDAGGVGLNLQRAASVCINLELPWNPAVLEQRIGRIYRLGQTQPIDVINLVNEYGIEARIAALIGNKQALFAGLFDGTTDTVRFDAPTGFLKDIERLVEPIQVPVFAVDAEGAEDTEMEADSVQPEAAPTLAALEREQISETAEVQSADRSATLEAVPREREETALTEGASTQLPLPPPPSVSAVSSLLQRVTVTRTENGGLHLEAPPEAAEELLQLLQGLTTLLTAATRDGSESGSLVETVS